MSEVKIKPIDPDKFTGLYGKRKLRGYQATKCHEVVTNIKYQVTQISAGVKDFFEPCYAVAYTAAGKSSIMAAVAKYYADMGFKVMILVRQADLVLQDSKTCTMMKALNGRYCASHLPKDNSYNIVVGSESTVANEIELGGAFFEKEDVPHVVMIDECHCVDNKETQRLIDDPNLKTKNQFARILAHFRKQRPRQAVVGFTGTPFRGNESIEGVYWTGGMVGDEIGRQWLTENGYIHDVAFDFPDNSKVDLERFFEKIKGGHHDADFTSEQLAEIAKEVDTEDKNKSYAVYMQYVMQDRNAALVTCASKNHCKNIAKHLPKGSYAIITDDTKTSDREKYLSLANRGEIKYVLQVKCLSTGVDVPLWDTIFLLRPIMSLGLLIQLAGRGVRLLEDWQKDKKFIKNECLFIDFSHCLEYMHSQFCNPMLEKAVLEKHKKQNKLTEKCPACGTMNSEAARRCRGVSDEDGSRCEYFFISKECPTCGKENDPQSENCRACGGEMKDPAEKLHGTHYKPGEKMPVKDMEVKFHRTGLSYKVFYDAFDDDGNSIVFSGFVPTVGRTAKTQKKVRAMAYNGFCKNFIKDKGALRYILRKGVSVESIREVKDCILTPTHATYRPGSDKVKPKMTHVYHEEINCES